MTIICKFTLLKNWGLVRNISCDAHHLPFPIISNKTRLSGAFYFVFLGDFHN